MKKIVGETLNEYTQNSLNELDLRTFSNKKESDQPAQSKEPPRTVLFNFFKSIKGKQEVPDENVTSVFDKVYSSSFEKYPWIKEASSKWSVAQKFQLMQKSYNRMEQDEDIDTPQLVIKDGKVIAWAYKSSMIPKEKRDII